MTTHACCNHLLASFTDVPVTSQQKDAAKQAVSSKATIPHGYASIDVDLSALLAKISAQRLHTVSHLKYKLIA